MRCKGQSVTGSFETYLKNDHFKKEVHPNNLRIVSIIHLSAIKNLIANEHLFDLCPITRVYTRNTCFCVFSCFCDLFLRGVQHCSCLCSSKSLLLTDFRSSVLATFTKIQINQVINHSPYCSLTSTTVNFNYVRTYVRTYGHITPSTSTSTSTSTYSSNRGFTKFSKFDAYLQKNVTPAVPVHSRMQVQQMQVICLDWVFGGSDML